VQEEYLIEKVGESLVIGIRKEDGVGIRFALRAEGNFEEFLELVKEYSLNTGDFKGILSRLYRAGRWNYLAQLLIYLKALDGDVEEMVALFPTRLPLIVWFPQIEYQFTAEAVKDGLLREKTGPDYEAQAIFLAIQKLISARHPEAPDLLASFLKSNWGYKASTLKKFHLKVEEAVEEVLKTYILPPNLEHFLRAWLYRRYKISLKTSRSLKKVFQVVFEVSIRPFFGNMLGAILVLTGVLIESASGIEDFFFWRVVVSHRCFPWIAASLSFVFCLLPCWLEIKYRVPERLRRLGRAFLVLFLIIGLTDAFVTGLLILALGYLRGYSNVWRLYPLFWSIVLIVGLISQLIWEDKAFVEQLQVP